MTTPPNSSSVSGGMRELVGVEVLVVDQDKQVTDGMAQLLSGTSLHVTVANNFKDAQACLQRSFYSVAIVDTDTPTPAAGIELITAIKTKSPTSMVIALTPRKSFSDSMAAIRAGAIDVVFKSPQSVGYLRQRVLEAVELSVNRREVDSVLAEVRDAQDEFLELFMSAENRAVDLQDQLTGRDTGALSRREEIHLLIVEPESSLSDALKAASPPGYVFDTAHSGGQALDKASSSGYQIALVSEQIQDLPSSMVLSSVKAQDPELVALAFSPPPGGKVEIIETSRSIPVVEDFNDSAQLIERLDELAEGFRAKAKQRRYTQAFRERHYDFLRRYVDLKKKIERALE